jgi:hypothetical protein
MENPESTTAPPEPAKTDGVSNPPVGVWERLFRAAGLLSFLLAAVGLIWNKCQQSSIDESSYAHSALAARPMIEPCYTASAESVHARLDSFRVTGDTALMCLSHMALKLTVAMVNSSAEPAEPLTCFALDDPDQSPIIRDYVCGRPVKRKPVRVELSAFRPTVVHSDSLRVQLRGEIEALSPDGATIMHVLVLYENAAGMLYDTYMCIPIRPTRATFASSPSRAHPSAEDGSYAFGKEVDLPGWVIKTEGTIRNLHVYTQSEARRVRRLLRS